MPKEESTELGTFNAMGDPRWDPDDPAIHEPRELAGPGDLAKNRATPARSRGWQNAFAR